MKLLHYTILVISFFASCKNSSTNLESPRPDTLNVNNIESAFASFEKDTLLTIYAGIITLPKGWRLAKEDSLPIAGDATVRYRFHNKTGKLIFLQYGLNTIGNPSELKVRSAIFRRGYVENNADTSDILFSDNPRLIKIRKKSNYLYSSETISTFQATFFKPKKYGNGYIGIYIDSVGQIAGNIADMVLYADGLDSVEVEEFKKISRGLIIKDFK